MSNVENTKELKEIKDEIRCEHEGCCGGNGHKEHNHVCKCAEAAKVSGQPTNHTCGCGHHHNHATKQQVEAINSLEDTVALMTSASFADRLRAEYWQTKLRYENLKKLNNLIEASEYGVVEFTKDALKTPKELFRAQQKVMGEYLHILEVRAVAERIEL